MQALGLWYSVYAAKCTELVSPRRFALAGWRLDLRDLLLVRRVGDAREEVLLRLDASL